MKIKSSSIIYRRGISNNFGGFALLASANYNILNPNKPLITLIHNNQLNKNLFYKI
mgnify:CR=1 FL=1